MGKQLFEIDWEGGTITWQLLQALLWEYLSKFGGQAVGITVAEIVLPADNDLSPAE